VEWVKRNKILDAGQTRKIRVQARPLGDIFNEYGIPRYCKIDIEGNGLDALRSLVDCQEVIPRTVRSKPGIDGAG
jgi:hypothetical protein